MPKVERLLKFKDTPDGSITRSSSRGGGAGGTGITGWKESRTLVVAAADSTAHGRAYADYVCDGTNDEVQINQALAMSVPSRYRGVTLLEGTFHIAATIDQMQSNTILEGQGDATVLRVVNSHNANLKVIDVTSVNDVAIERLRIDGNRANQSSGAMYMIYANTVNNLLITNTSIVNARGGSIFADTLTRSRIEGNYLYNSAIYESIWIDASTHTVIANNVVYDCKDIYLYDSSFCVVSGNNLYITSIRTYDCDHCSIVGNTLDAPDRGIDIEGGSGVVITGNAIEDSDEWGISLYDGSATPDGATVVGNTCLNCDGWGIIIAADASLVDGNVCVDNGSGGIQFYYSDRTIISNNVCVGPPWSMYVWRVNGSVIDGNICYRASLDGIVLIEVNDTLVANNYFEANSTYDGALPHIRLEDSVIGCKFSDNVFREGGEANAPDYCIEIVDATSENNMILDNDFRGGATAGSINDVGTGTQIVDTFTDAGVVRTWVTSGDVAHVWTIAGVDEWYAGVDDGDADKWKLGIGSAVGTTVAVTADSALDVGIGTEAPAGQLHVDQSAAGGAQPVLYLDQADVDEEFIRFDGTSAADQTKSISTVNGDGAVTGPKDFSASAGWAFEGMVRININGTDRWMPYYSADTS